MHVIYFFATIRLALTLHLSCFTFCSIANPNLLGFGILLSWLYFQFIKMSGNVIEPRLKYHLFSDKIMDTVVNFQVLKLRDSFYVWIGTSNKLGNVTVAMPTKFVSFKPGHIYYQARIQGKAYRAYAPPKIFKD